MVDITVREGNGFVECMADFSKDKIMTNIEKTVVALFTLVACMLVFAFFAGVVMLFNYGVDKNEVAECNKWKSEAAEFSSNPAAAAYYITQWQKDQCNSHGITIDAQVK